MTIVAKIQRISFFRAASPLSRPIADATHSISEIAFIVTRIVLDNGVTGDAYLLAFHYSPRAIVGALCDAAPMALGWDVSRTAEFLAHYQKESEYFGNVGLHRWAEGSINVAMWDAAGKCAGMPVWRMLGGRPQRVAVYGSGGWLSYSIDELLDEARRYVKRGFRAVKVKVGSADLEQDIERLTRVRETVGGDVGIMMDANQGLDVASAMRLMQRVAPLRIEWFEEPLPHTDFVGYQQLRRAGEIPLAMGEREFDTVALRELIAHEAIDLWQPDLLRLGSVEAWRASAALAGAHQIPVLPHYYKEYDVPLLMTIPNAHAAESFDWVDDLIDRPVNIRDGYAYPSDEPGWGFKFKDDHLSELAMFER